MQQNIQHSPQLDWQRQGHILTFSGVLDRDTLLSFWPQREALLADVIEINLEKLVRVDTAGLAMLVCLSHGRVSAPLRFTGLADALQALVSLYHLLPMITFAEP